VNARKSKEFDNQQPSPVYTGEGSETIRKE